MGKKLIIAVGTSRYDHLPPDLQRPQLNGVVDSVVGLFTGKLGYERVLEDISSDPASDQLSTKLDRWFASSERDSSDWVVFYYTGHGELVSADKLYLLTRNYESGLTTTALSVQELGSMLIGKDASGENRKVRRCLLILDTCHSGAGALGLAHEIGKLFSEGANGGMFYVLAAAFPREEAWAGALAGALLHSLEDDSLGGAQQPFIYFDQLLPAINRRLKAHKIVYSPVLSPDEEPQFFPNPRYNRNVPLGATVAEIHSATESGEFESFWGPTSRGVEMEFHPGWYFTGRERALGELSDWLRDAKDYRTRVITGRPGSGKSAILSKIVTVSDSAYRQRMPENEQRWGRAFPAECINLAIHAKGKTSQEIICRLAGQLGVEPTQPAVLAALNAREQPFHIVIDALDEAREPERISIDLLTTLHTLPKVKLIVGTRPEYADKLGRGAVQLYVDQHEYFEKADLATYVEARLLRVGERGGKTRYEGKKDLARRVGEAVAAKASPNFLIARLVAEDLLAEPEALDEAAIAARDFPDSVTQAFARYLARFGPAEKKVRDLLTPLAWAEGVGLPWGNTWPAVASALSGRAYGNDDVRWVMERAGSFVVETLEEDRSVYRLYHQALADYLRQACDNKEAQRAIVRALIDTVPALGDTEEKDAGENKDWRLAHPYLRTHLAEHASACGMLAELVKSPLYLLTANPNHLLAVMEAYPQEVPLEIAHIYHASFHHVKSKPLVESVSYLEMAARKSMATHFADQVAQLPLHPTWNIPWARWLPSATHRILSQDNGKVIALAVAEREGRTVIVSGSDDTSVRIWDLERGEAVGVLSGHNGVVATLVVVELQGRTVIVSGSYDSTIRLWDLERGEAVGFPLIAPSGVVSLGVAELQGRTVIVAGCYDQSIRIWDWERGETVGPPLTGHEVPTSSLVVAERQGRTVIVSRSYESTIRLWDLERGEAVDFPLIAPSVVVSCWGVAELQGRTVIVAGCYDKSIRIWDLERGNAVGPPLIGHTDNVHALAVTQRQGRTVIVSGSDDTSIRIWDLERGNAVGPPLIGHTDNVRALAVAQRQGRTVIVSGSDDTSIRIWDLEQGEVVATPFSRHAAPVYALAVAERQGRTVVVSGSDDNSIRIWDLEEGETVGPPLTGHAGLVTSLAVAERQGRTVIVSGSDDKSIRIWDLEQGEAVGTLTGQKRGVAALAVAERKGRTVIVSGSDDGLRSGSAEEGIRAEDGIRIWDLEQGKAVARPLYSQTLFRRAWEFFRFHFVHGVNTLAVAKRQGRTVIVSGSAQDGIRIWDLEQGRAAAPVSHNFHVYSLTVAKWQGRTVIVAGRFDGTICIWDLERGEAVGFLSGHSGAVVALAVAELQGRTIIVSGAGGRTVSYLGYDHTIRIWDLESFALMQAIDTGAPVVNILFAPPSTIVVGTVMGLMTIQLAQH
jgi:WD40 repeat protein